MSMDILPADLMLFLSQHELTNLISQIATSRFWGGRRELPNACTELPGVMIAPTRAEIRDISQIVTCSTSKHARRVNAFTGQGVARLSSAPRPGLLFVLSSIPPSAESLQQPGGEGN
jgi:hypothetical protein